MNMKSLLFALTTFTLCVACQPKGSDRSVGKADCDRIERQY